MGRSWKSASLAQRPHFDILHPTENPGWCCTWETETGGLVTQFTATQRGQGQSGLQETLSQNGTEGIKSAHCSGL